MREPVAFLSADRKGLMARNAHNSFVMPIALEHFRLEVKEANIRNDIVF
jgi:hypothetical protein